MKADQTKKSETAAGATATASEPTTSSVERETAGSATTVVDPPPVSKAEQTPKSSSPAGESDAKPKATGKNKGKKAEVTTESRNQEVPLAGSIGEIVSVAIPDLVPNPRNAEIYLPSELDALAASIKAMGMVQPITALRTGVILIGHRRYAAAKMAKLKHVPVVYVDIAGKNEQDEMIVLSNLHRSKNREENIREFLVILPIETERASERMNAGTNNEGGKNSAHGKKGKAADIAADRVGMSRPTAVNGAKVLGVIDKLIADGQQADADLLRDILNNQSIDGAYKRAVEMGLIAKSISATKTTTESGDKPGSGQVDKQTADESAGGENQQPKPEQIAPSSPMETTSVEPASAGVNTDQADAHGVALAQADDALTFLRGRSSVNLTDQQKVDWAKVLKQIIDHLKRLGVSAA